MSSLVADPAAPRVVPQAEPAVLSQVTPTTDQFKFLNNALNDLTGDVVIMGGYRGSILRSAQPPHRQLWIPVKVGLNLRKVDLEVGLKPEDEEKMHESIIPSGMLTHIGPIDISRRLIKKLRACENARNGKLRVWEYGYDWRLSPHLLSRKLISALENLPSNRKGTPLQDSGALIIAHSLGGLITRHVINQRPELVSGVLYAGVPQHCVNILGPLRNGDEVLLSSKVLTAQVNFTIRTSFALLPEDGSCFLDKTTKEAYPVNFFDANTWIENRLSPCVAAPLPPLSKTTSGLGSLVEAVSGGLPKLPLRATWKLQDAAEEKDGDSLDPIEPRMNGHGNAAIGKGPSSSSSWSVSTVCTLPRDEAIAYLRRTLAETLKFKQELVVRPELRETNAYPPIAVLYGKTVPTVYGAKVDGREGIKRADAYDRLAFASGDGVCLARAAMVPEGYETVPNGRISSDRGHVNLLGDLEGVGRAIKAIQAGRRRGIGLGKK
ncbi:MAG: hypothetical protein M1825_004869 [Sarcosagium campestre]|nr:MAG: hypothetical protein M1825_004869 [Sarcosagium campestre]